MGVGDDDTMVNRPCSFTMGSKRGKQNLHLCTDNTKQIRDAIRAISVRHLHNIDTDMRMYAYKSMDAP